MLEVELKFPLDDAGSTVRVERAVTELLGA
jgi:hypothetical protein